MENQNQYEEISLVELVVMWLKAWKIAVLAGLLVTVLAASVVSALSLKYESKVSLQISSLGHDLLVDPSVLVTQLQALHRVGDDTQGKRELPRLEKISNDKRSESPVVDFTVRAYSAESAADFLSELSQKIIADHAVMYQKNRQEKQALYEQLLAQKGDNGGVLAQIQNDLAIMNPSKLLSAPSISVQPASPNKPMLYAVSLILGLIVMLILPFVLAFIDSVKEELQRQAEK